MRIIYGFCLLFLLCSMNGLAQGTNSCGVIARISPGTDTVVTDTSVIHFINQSVNYTDFRFILHGIQYPMNYALGRMNFAIGMHELKLVAYNGSCTDTAVVYIFQPGKQPLDRTNIKAYYGLHNRNQHSTSIDATQDGGYIIGAHVTDNYYWRFPDQGLLIKTKESGCIEWSRLYQTENFIYGKIHTVKAVADGGFAATAFERFQTSSFFKVDANGNLLWSKVYMGNSGIPFLATGLEVTDDGGYILSGPYGNTAFMILKLDASGNVVWGRQLNKGLTNIFPSDQIAQKGNDVFVAIALSYYTGNTYNYASILIKLNYLTGNVEWTKKYKTEYNDVGIRDIHILPGDELLVNSFAGGMPGKKPLNTFLVLDLNGYVKTARTVYSNVTTGVGYTSMVPLSNGQYYILVTGSEPVPLQPGIAHHSIVMKMRADYSIPWGKEYGGITRGRLFYPSKGPIESLAVIGDEAGAGIPAYSITNKIVFWRMDSSGTDPNTCNLWTISANTEPTNTTIEPFTWTHDSSVNIITEVSKSKLAETFTNVRYDCPSFVDSCSFVKITGPGAVCNLNNHYTYKIHKNKSCMMPVQWSTRGSVQVIQQTDSSLIVKFGSFGINSIQALLPYSCSPIKDSLEVIAASKTSPLNLGPDTSICVNNTLSLKAGPKFFNYQWQDGSTDSILTINAPGQYWVKVTDSCDNVLSDTITITAAAPIPFSAGADRIKCNNDTIQLSAPAGFLQYTWSPAYNINASNRQQVIVNPKIDTAYYVQAEKTPGCFAYDTIRVKVNTSPPIQLGQDTSFCQGDSSKLDAGNGFASYQWNNGNNSQQISVKTAGTFSVIGTTTDGCKSYDTLKVIKVFANPTVQLDATSFLCTGATKTLDAGSFASYSWSDGSISRTLLINATGIYSVKVTDNNQCKGSDTVAITSLRPLPQDFLPADTLICNYGKLQLRSLTDFKNYLWSTNELTPSITISKSGRYSLQVTDQYGCIGKDSMIVSPKDCLSGFYIPNVFTPNNDGKNDVFKPMLFGRIIKYDFVIYNRWGQKVFQTNDINKGWTGNYIGSESTNQYVWTCTFQLEGETVKSEKGTVILMR